MQVRADDPRHPRVAPLVAEHIADQLGNTPAGFAFVLGADALAAPDIDFFSVWDGDTLMGMGALKVLGADSGEVKSMRSTTAARGRGAGHAVLRHIIATARARGYRALYLETGTTPPYDAALTLYRRAGFVSCPPFGDYVASPHNQFLMLDLGED
ncbi:GNAT family N-acetyltransferase [Sphingomonas sp.]|jgi:putative acetyltransferase|uniref:GNAT family N-acetyltransferase n=1 Tax=Sphingomonas sp. TaxID=28214 RepID=UPI0035C8058A